MFKQFNDFEFDGKKFSELSSEYIQVNLGDEMDISIAMERDMESGDTNKYRTTESNYFGDKWSDTLPLELHIIKDPCVYSSQSKQAITQKDLRELTKWLTSPHYPNWIVFDNVDENDDVTRYCGWFNNIEPFAVNGYIYGLKLHFKCTTPFGFTEIKSNIKTVTTYENMIVTNDSDESQNYCYPTVKIKPNDNGEVFIVNMSDCNILDEGQLTESYFSSLLTKVQAYATLQGYTLTYTGTGAQNIIPICNNTAVQFYLEDIHNGIKKKCTAFYRTDNYKYTIVDGGFVYMKVYQDLEVHMNCQHLTINNSIGRMITYDKLGVTDVDHIYWLRLLNGNNTLLLHGNAEFEILHQESRKVGEY